jgi:drug/metabolite transporter (DMT)-like permease
MKHTFLIRLGGLAPVLGGVIYAVASLLGDPFSMADVTRSWARVFKVSFILFLLGVIAVIVALHLLQRERYGRKGALASASAFVGVVGVALSFGFDFGFLRFAKEVYLFNGMFELLAFLGLVATVVGMVGIVALGIVTLRAGVLPWWCGLALIPGNPLFEIYLFFFGLDNLYGTWPVVVPWVVVGFAVFLAPTYQAQQPSRVK